MSKKSEHAAQENHGDEQSLKYMLEIASSGGGSLAGAFLGLLVAGPAGGLVGALCGGAGGKAIEIALRAVCQEIWARQSSARERMRVGTVLDVVITEIRRRVEAGESVRADGFFDAKQAGRSDAEEVAESVLLKAQREPEDKKIEYMGHLFASIAFNPEISVQMAHQLIKVAEQLTYRQLCILKLCDVKDKYNLRDKDYRDQDVDKKDLYQVLYECAELDNKQYINSRGKADLHGREFADFGATIDGLTRAIPSGMSLQGIGKDLFNLMKLSLIPCRDITPISEQLK